MKLMHRVMDQTNRQIGQFNEEHHSNDQKFPKMESSHTSISMEPR